MVVATGRITGVGTCTLEQPSPGVTIVHVILPDGTLDIDVTTINHVGEFDDQACVFRFTDTETYTITGRSGAYVGATGSGTDTLGGVFTSPRTAAVGCDQSRSRGVIVAVGSGTASV
jgi:hypothetical protein